MAKKILKKKAVKKTVSKSIKKKVKIVKVKPAKPKIMLVVCDGFGEGPATPGNAITQAKMPFLAELKKKASHTVLEASGKAVGLPDGYQGGSEVGHFTMGAGRVVWQFLEEINQSIKKETFFKKKPLLDAVKYIQKHDSTLHLVGMISDEGVHSHMDHLFALLSFAKSQKLSKVFIHAITDGRDVPERSAQKYMHQILRYCKKINLGRVATIIGRYYAMDRDDNWKRTQGAYDAMVKGKGQFDPDPVKAIERSYERGIATDYYIKPIVVNRDGMIQKNDAVVCFNYRTDRARQLTAAFVNKKFTKFARKKIPVFWVCMGPYSKEAPVLFPQDTVKNNLGDVLSKAKIPQLRIAETEKYAHVTYFFNSQIEKPTKTETRILVDSPKCPSYAEKPEMSARQVTKRLLAEIAKKKFGFILVNYANMDLVGHSGNLAATVKCCEVIDECLGKVIPEAVAHGYTVLLTGDHGNAEEMLYENGTPCPAHTRNPVPFFLLSPEKKKEKLVKKAGLATIAPTVLKILKITKPKEMKEKSLV